MRLPDRESVIGASESNGNLDYPSTFELLYRFNYGHKDFDLASKRMWVDYVSLRPCQKGDWDQAVVVELVADLGVVVAAIDPRMLFLSRSWCIFEIYCAARAMLEHGGQLHCPIGGGMYIGGPLT